MVVIFQLLQQMYFLSDGNIFQPDVIFVSAENRNKIIGGKIEFAPDLCIEILSPATAYYDIKHKKRMYESYGVKEYVIIDPLDVSAEVYRLKEQSFKLEETVYAEGVLTLQTIIGFSVSFNKLFL
jgi:Uma2 family endonuclease